MHEDLKSTSDLITLQKIHPLRTCLKTIIFDNDAANDDIIALIYLTSHPAIKLAAITIAGTGEAHGDLGAKNMADVCFMLNIPATPIAFGTDQPLSSAGKPFPDFIRTMMDNTLANKNIPHHPNPNISDSAVELIKQTLNASPEPVTILCTGPLTNIAAFIQANPDQLEKIEKIVIMGGAINVEGNIQALDPQSTNQVAEWNIYADPAAASLVFGSGIPITLVPLDATNQVPITQAFYDALSLATQPGLNLAYLLLKDIVDEFGMDLFLKNFYLWDPLAAMICLNPALAITEHMTVTVDQETAGIKPVPANETNVASIQVAMQLPAANLILEQFLKETSSIRPTAPNKARLYQPATPFNEETDIKTFKHNRL